MLSEDASFGMMVKEECSSPLRPTRLPSISQLKMTSPSHTPSTSPRSVSFPAGSMEIRQQNDESCAKSFLLHNSSGYTILDTTSKDYDHTGPRLRECLPPVLDLIREVDTALRSRRSSCDSQASTPSFGSFSSRNSPPLPSPQTPSEAHSHYPWGSHSWFPSQSRRPSQAALPAKFHGLSQLEESLAQNACYDSRKFRHSVASPRRGIRKDTVCHIRRTSEPIRDYEQQTQHQPMGDICHGMAEAHHQSRSSHPHDLHSTTRRQSASRTPARPPHINVPYTEEQNHWIIYHRVDLAWSWKAVTEGYAAHFLNSELPRTDGGLQSGYYRFNEKVPVVTEDGLLVLDDLSEHKFKGVGYRVRPVKTRDAKVTLIDRYAEEVAEANYSWILPDDMACAKMLAVRRRQQRDDWIRQKQAPMIPVFLRPHL